MIYDADTWTGHWPFRPDFTPTTPQRFQQWLSAMQAEHESGRTPQLPAKLPEGAAELLQRCLAKGAPERPESLAALLGYQLERGLHDRNKEVEVDKYIYILRREFPLAGNQFESTHVEDGDIPIQAIEARNVVHGLDLIRFVEKRLGPNGEPRYFKDLKLKNISRDHKKIIEEENRHIKDLQEFVGCREIFTLIPEP